MSFRILNDDDQRKLSEMFSPKKAYGKVLLPIGVHEVRCTLCEWRTTRVGKGYLSFELWKKPDIMYYDSVQKVSFGKLKFFHIPCEEERDTEWRNDWFAKTYSDTMPLHYLEYLYHRLLQKPSFKVVVGQIQEYAKTRTITGLEYERLYWNNFIRSVHRLDEEVKLTNADYFSLYRPAVEKIKRQEIICPF